MSMNRRLADSEMNQLPVIVFRFPSALKQTSKINSDTGWLPGMTLARQPESKIATIINKNMKTI